MTDTQEDKLVGKILKALDPRFDKLESTVDKLVIKVVSMDARMDTFATKDELHALEDRITTVLDEHTVILHRLDQERAVTNFRLDRLESHPRLA